MRAVTTTRSSTTFASLAPSCQPNCLAFTMEHPVGHPRVAQVGGTRLNEHLARRDAEHRAHFIQRFQMHAIGPAEQGVELRRVDSRPLRERHHAHATLAHQRFQPDLDHPCPSSDELYPIARINGRADTRLRSSTYYH